MRNGLIEHRKVISSHRAITIGSIGVASDPSLEKTQYLPTGSGSKNTGSGSELLYENYDWVLGSKYVQI